MWRDCTSPKTIPDASLKSVFMAQWLSVQLSANHPSDPQRKLLIEQLPFDEWTNRNWISPYSQANTSRSIHGRLCLFRWHSMTWYYMSFGEGHLSHGCSWAGSIKSLSLLTAGMCSDSYLAVLLKKKTGLTIGSKDLIPISNVYIYIYTIWFSNTKIYAS